MRIDPQSNWDGALGFRLRVGGMSRPSALSGHPRRSHRRTPFTKGSPMKSTLNTAAAFLLAIAGQAIGQLQHGVLNVREVNGGNVASSVAVTRSGGFGAWTITAGSCNRADYAVNFGNANDTTSGVFLTSPMETQR